MMQVQRYVIVISGNHGVGATSLHAALNHLFRERGLPHLAFESARPQSDHSHEQMRGKVGAGRVDQASRMYCFEKRPQLIQQLQIDNCTLKVRHIILQAQVSTILRRLKTKLEKTAYHTECSLSYFATVYRSLAYHYSAPLLSTQTRSPKQLAELVLGWIETGFFQTYKALDFSSLRFADVHEKELASLVYKQLDSTFKFPGECQAALFDDGLFGEEVRALLNQNTQKQLFSKWLARGQVTPNPGYTSLKVSRGKYEATVQIKDVVFVRVVEGESKQLFRVYCRGHDLHSALRLILLKSTIYSHRQQTTSEIADLGSVRAEASQVFLDLLHRNKLEHSYLYINSNGVILSREVYILDLELVFKKWYIGTDKHSYFGLKQTGLVGPDLSYREGPYVRFDWRNPNFILNSSGKNVFNNEFYFTVEALMGKSQFYLKVLKESGRCTAVGDKCLSPALAERMVDPTRVNDKIIQIYCVLQYYLGQVGLQAIDGCFMADRECKYLWSEINPDCLRIKSMTGEDFDKDIWRKGGEKSKSTVKATWTALTSLLRDYLLSHRFHQSQLLAHEEYPFQIQARRELNELTAPTLRSSLQRLIGKMNLQRRFLLTLDLNDGRPTLVKSSEFAEQTEGGLSAAIERLRMFQEVEVVDLNGAFGQRTKNRGIIKELCCRYGWATGGGIRTDEDVRQLLESKACRLVLSTNLGLLNQIPKERLTVELAVNQQMEVLVEGRRVNTKQNALVKIKELAKLGVVSISVTFVAGEGQLVGVPKQLVRRIFAQLPGPVKQVFIAGGIKDIEDVRFIWKFEKAVPKLGSCFWKGRLSGGQLMAESVQFQDGLMPTIVFEKGVVKGLVYLNQEALVRSIQTKRLHRYSRRHKRVMMKGEVSGCVHELVTVRADCDRDALLAIVEGRHSPFCHQGSNDCFKSPGISLELLDTHISKSVGLTSYSGRLMASKGKAVYKLQEEVLELSCTRERGTEQAADVLAHWLMLLRASGISLSSVMEQLWRRVSPPRPLPAPAKPQLVRVGVNLSKYKEEVLQFCAKHLGFQLQSTGGRNYLAEPRPTSQDLMLRLFGTLALDIIQVKNKDCAGLLSAGLIDYSINYNTSLVDLQTDCHPVLEVPIDNVRLVLMQRIDQEVKVQNWTKKNKGLVFSEHPLFASEMLREAGVREDCYKLVRVEGCVESYLHSFKQSLCESVLVSGATMEANGLKIWRESSRKTYLGLYKANI